MYTNSNFKPYTSNVSLAKSRSTDNFYRRAAERSLKQHPAPNGVESDCLACKHERQTSFGRTSKQSFGMAPAKTSRKIVNEQYYKMNDVDQLTHVKKAKRYLEQLLEKTKGEFKRSVDLYQKRLAELSDELKMKNDAISDIKQQQNLKEAEQYYLANQSLVKTYQQSQMKNEETENLQAQKIRELTARNEELSDQLSEVYKMAAQKQNKIESIELEMTRMKQNEISNKQYEAMRGLISKMEEEKLRMLDRQHSQIQQFQDMNNQDKNIKEAKIMELQGLLEVKTRQLQGKQVEMQALKSSLSRYRDQQYQALREVMDQRDKECLQLESKINCVEAELNFVKGRYGYLLRMIQTDQLMDSRLNDPEEICIERIGRYQVSNGKESLLGMNMSPIKQRR